MFISNKYLTYTQNLPLLPLWSIVLVLFISQLPSEEKNRGDTGSSGNLFLTFHTLYANVSRCWDTGRSSCFLSHFKVYWLFRRWKLNSRLLQLKVICLPFDQNQILFCQTKCTVRQSLWVGFPAAAHIPSLVCVLWPCLTWRPDEVDILQWGIFAPLSFSPGSNLMKA